MVDHGRLDISDAELLGGRSRWKGYSLTLGRLSMQRWLAFSPLALPFVRPRRKKPNKPSKMLLLLLFYWLVFIPIFCVVALFGMFVLGFGALIYWCITPGSDSPHRSRPSTEISPAKARWADASTKTRWVYSLPEASGVVARQATGLPMDAAAHAADTHAGHGGNSDGSSVVFGASVLLLALIALAGSMPLSLLVLLLAGGILLGAAGPMVEAGTSISTSSHSEITESISKGSRKRLRRMRQQDGKDDMPVESGTSRSEGSEESWAAQDGKD